MTEARAVSEHTEFSEVYESGINVEPENVAPSAATHPVSPPSKVEAARGPETVSAEPAGPVSVAATSSP